MSEFIESGPSSLCKKHNVVSMEIYYLNIRDKFGIVEDLEGIELSDRLALLIEVIRSADEFLRDVNTAAEMRFEVVDSQGRTVLMLPVRHILEVWKSLDALSLAAGSLH